MKSYIRGDKYVENEKYQEYSRFSKMEDI